MQGLVARTKRLRILIREDGLIVGASADDAWASEIFGVEPSKLVRQSIAQYLDVFHEYSKGGSGRLTPAVGTGDALLVSTVMPHVCELHEQVRSAQAVELKRVCRIETSLSP